MRALFCRPLILSGIVISLSFFHPSVTHAGMLGDLWGSIVGFFTGNKKNDPTMEAQIASLLEQTNQSQNSLIASINEMLSYQKELQDLNNTQDKEKMDLMMQSMQQAIQANQDNFLQLMQVREQLAQAGELEKYEQNIGQFIQKQQEIEDYYPKIEDRYNELMAFSDKTPDESGNKALNEASTSVNEGVTNLWENENIQAAIDHYLESNGLDEWGGPKVENAKIGRPPGAGNRSRYQYLWEANPEMREKLGDLIKSESSNQLVKNQEVLDQSENPSPGSDLEMSPAKAENSFRKNNASKDSKTNMAFSNRYDNVDLRNQRKEIYSRLVEMQNAGEISSEAYKDLYHEYTLLGQKLKKVSN